MLGLNEVGFELGARKFFLSDSSFINSVDAQGLDTLHKNGAQSFYVADSESNLELGINAIESALKRSTLENRQINALILCHTSPINTLPVPYSLVSELAQKTSLSHCFVTTITQQQCVSSLYGLKLATGLFKTHPHWEGAIICCIDKILNEEYRLIGDAGVHSDAASAIVVEPESPATVVAIETMTNSHIAKSIHASDLFINDPHYVWALVSLIRKTLKKSGVKADQLQSVLPHNVNLAVWKQVMMSLKLSETILFKENFSQSGHAFGSDTAINIATSGMLKKSGYHLIVSCGIGGCYGAILVENKTDYGVQRFAVPDP
ncbi:3-oxoacyl-[acyl-carrier-protein] synthase III C-terminal domain-containing protein [Gynuella sp.]|uniref:3-oxoacyl-[acyl-carrier-protein] synthase III C-terminal domain-containing protein n=1 Tax=Gynuella sp. TaxID=2969146 RepID=UPI003D0DC2C0